MTLCDRCKFMFHTLKVDGFENTTEGCACMKSDCACRQKREEAK